MTAPMKSDETTPHPHVRIHKSGHESYSFRANLALIQPVGYLLVFVLVAAWHLLLSWPIKIEGIVMSFTYSYIEYTWYTFTVQTEDHVVRIIPLAVKGRNGFTSVEQLLGNILYVPVALHGYSFLFNHPEATPGVQGLILCARIMLFPINIWVLEIIQDRVFRVLFGFNPAWDYTGAPGSRFGGAINLAHWKLWITLGTIAAFTSPYTGSQLLITLLTIGHLAKMYARFRAKTF